MRRFIPFILMILLAVTFSCKKKTDDNANNSAVQLGAVGNTWAIKVQDTYNITAELISKEGDIRTVEVMYATLFSKTAKFALTANEVTDYVYSEGDLGQPFTMVKFDAQIGDTYTATINGIYHTREVIERNTYNIPALGRDVETIGVLEWIPPEVPSTYFGYTIRQIIWYWSPVYGLVCVDVYTDQGEYFNVEFLSIDI